MKALLLVSVLLAVVAVPGLRAQPAAVENAGVSAASILARLDDNTAAGKISYQAVMRISIGGQVRDKGFFGYSEGGDSAYVEFTSPARDRGTRFLKLGSDMWMWIPRVGKSTKLSGHLLRQSMMGSDFSYSDATDNTRLEDEYEAELVGTDSIDGQVVYALDLVARSEAVDYGRQKLWVSVNDYVPVRVEYYAHSGKLLKEMRTEAFKRIGGRNFPTRVVLINLLRKNTWTEMEFTEVELDRDVPAEFFTKSYLER